MYSRLFVEILFELVSIKDKRQKLLVTIIKELRRMINFFGKDINDAVKRNPDLKILVNSNFTEIKSTSLTISSSTSFLNSKWLIEAKSLAYPEKRYCDDVQSAKKVRLQAENQDGILTMPLLEPYLEIKWPTKVMLSVASDSSKTLDSDEVLKEYTRQINERENHILSNKQFGI